MRKSLAFLFATTCYAGLIPGAPGTYASLLTTAGFLLTYRIGYRIAPELHVSVVCLIAALGTLAAAEVSRMYGDEDPSVVVIDEVAGQLVAFLFLPVSFFNVLAGFFLFRLFDIWKPFPIRNAERLKNGVGIMADDLLAGVYTNVILQAANVLAVRRL
jgi:phosphatidylglycerophosphatase A